MKEQVKEYLENNKVVTKTKVSDKETVINVSYDKAIESLKNKL